MLCTMCTNRNVLLHLPADIFQMYQPVPQANLPTVHLCDGSVLNVTMNLRISSHLPPPFIILLGVWVSVPQQSLNLHWSPCKDFFHFNNFVISLRTNPDLCILFWRCFRIYLTFLRVIEQTLVQTVKALDLGNFFCPNWFELYLCSNSLI